MGVKRAFVTAAMIFAAVITPTSLAFAVVDSTTRVAVGNGPWGIAVSPDGARTYVVNSTSPQSISVIDNSTQSAVVTIPLTGRTSAYGIAVSPDGTFIVVSSPADNSITKIQTTSPYAQTTFAVGASTPLQLALSSDGQYAYVTCNGSNSVAKIELVPSGYVGYVPTGISPVGIVRKPGTNLYYVVNQDGPTVSVIDGTSMNSTATIATSVLEPHGIAFTPDGNKAFVTARVSDQVSVISGSSNTEISVFSVGDYPQGVAVSTDGSKVYVANSAAGTVEVFSTDTYSKLETAISNLNPTEIAVSPTNNSIWVTKFNDASVDNIFFSWPEPETQANPENPQLVATGFSYEIPLIVVGTLLVSGLFAFRLKDRRFQ